MKRGFIKIWSRKPPRTYQRVLLRYNDGRKWRYMENWQVKWMAVITPMFRLLKRNREVQIGLGNHFVEIGW